MSLMDILIRERARVVRLAHAGTTVAVLAAAAAILVLGVQVLGGARWIGGVPVLWAVVVDEPASAGDD